MTRSGPAQLKPPLSVTLPPTAILTGAPSILTCTMCPLTNRKMVQNSVQQPALTSTKSSVCPSLAALAAPTTTGPSGGMSVTEVAENGTACVPYLAAWTTSRKLTVVLALPTGTSVTLAAGCPGPSRAQATEAATEGTAAAGRLAEGGADDDAGGGDEEAADGGTEDGAGDEDGAEAEDDAEGEADGPGDATTGWLAEGEADTPGVAATRWLAEGVDEVKEGSADLAAVGTACWSAVGSAVVGV